MPVSKQEKRMLCRKKNDQNLSRYHVCAPNADIKASFKNKPVGVPELFLSSSVFHRSKRGSILLEAAVVLPLAVFFLSSFLYLFLLIGYQMNLQKVLEETGEQFSMGAAVSGVNHEWTEDFQTAMAVRLAENKAQNLQLPGLVCKQDWSRSELSVSRQTLLLCVDYELRIPAGLLGNITFSFCQQSEKRLWTGSEGIEWNLEKPEKKETEETVYVTPSGSAYHWYSDCPYLKPSIRAVSAANLVSERNASGSGYTACKICGKSAPAGTVYVTTYGTKYHTSLSCSELTRTVQAISLADALGRTECQKCRARKAAAGS